MLNTKVLHVVARMNVGGTARYIEELVINIPGSALATGVVQDAEVEDEAVSRLLVYRIPHMGRKIAPLKDFRSWIELRSLIKLLKPEIVHTHTFKAGLIGRLIKGSHRNVHTFHGHLFGDDSFNRIAKVGILLAERFLAKKTDLLISVGINVGKELRQIGIGEKNKWLSIAPGVLQLPKIEKKKAREELGLSRDQFLVGWMARVTAVKNPHLLLEVAEMMPDVSFIVAGGGDLLEEIQALAPENVTILGWTEASVFWSAVDCAISTSNNEGMPIALIEAQLAGIPVVATDVGSNSEVISHQVTGFVTPRTPIALVAALRSLLNDRDLCAEMGRQASSRAQTIFSKDELINAHQTAYQTLL